MAVTRRYFDRSPGVEGDVGETTRIINNYSFDGGVSDEDLAAVVVYVDERIDDVTTPTVQLVGGASGTIIPSARDEVYVHVTSTAASWTLDLSRLDVNTAADLYITIDSSGAHTPTFANATVEWVGGSAPAGGNWADGKRAALHFMRVPFTDVVRAELIHSTDTPAITIPTVVDPPDLTFSYSTSATRSGLTALSDATLPSGEVAIVVGPNDAKIKHVDIWHDQSPPALTWAAPDTAGYTTISVPTTGYTSTLDHNTDYVFDMPAEPVTAPVWIKGGRNVVMVGGEIKIDTVTYTTAPGANESTQQGIYIIRHPTAGVHASRIVHIEGVKIHGYYMSDGIRTASNDGGPTDAIIRIQNCRIEVGMWYRDGSAASGNQSSPHGDLIQPFGGCNRLEIDGLTGLCTGQGLQINEDLNTITGPHYLRRINLRANDVANTEYNDVGATWPRPAGDGFVGRYYLWTDADMGGMNIDQGTVWIDHPTRTFAADEPIWPDGSPHGSDATGTYMNPTYGSGWDGTGDGYVYEGSPPDGDYVTTAGFAYTSPEDGTGTLPAVGSEDTVDSYVGRRSTQPLDFLGGSISTANLWDTATDPTGNNRAGFNRSGPNYIQARATYVDDTTAAFAVPFSTGNPVVATDYDVTYGNASVVSDTQTVNITTPDAADRAVVVVALYRALYPVTSLTLGGNPMTVVTSQYSTASDTGLVVARISEDLMLAAGVHAIVPTFSGSIGANTLCHYHYWIFEGAPGVTFAASEPVFENTGAPMAVSLTPPASATVMSVAGHQTELDALTNNWDGTAETALVTDAVFNQTSQAEWKLGNGASAVTSVTWTPTNRSQAVMVYASSMEGAEPPDPVTPSAAPTLTSPTNPGDNQLRTTWTAVDAPVSNVTTHDVIVDTDLGGDPDDIQSLVRLCMYSDILKVKGVISSQKSGSSVPANVTEWIKRSDVDYLRSRGYTDLMTEAQLLATFELGDQSESGPASGKNTAGSDLIISVANDVGAAYDRTTNPLWILVWGTLGTVAQALFDDSGISSKIRIYSIGSFNTRGNVEARDYVYDFMVNTDNNLWWIENGIYPLQSYDTFRGIWEGGNQTGEWDNVAFLNQNIRDHGSNRGGTYAQITGDAFPAGEGPAGAVGALKEGDSPSMMYLLSPQLGGVGDVDDPTVPSWGGRFELDSVSYPNYYHDRTDGSAADARATISVHRVDYLTDFKARWDRYQTTAGVTYEGRIGTSNPPTTSVIPLGSTTSWTRSGLTAATTYYMQVRAVSSTGARSAWSPAVSGTTNASDPPPPPPPSNDGLFPHGFYSNVSDITHTYAAGINSSGLFVPNWHTHENLGPGWGSIEYATTTNSKVFGYVATEWGLNASRRSAVQESIGPQAYLTVKLSQEGHPKRGAQPSEAEAALLDMARSGSTGSDHRRDVFAQIARNLKGWTVDGRQVTVFYTVSHESNGSWYSNYSGVNPNLVGSSVLASVPDSQFGAAMGAAVRGVADDGNCAAVHKLACENSAAIMRANNTENLVLTYVLTSSGSSAPPGDLPGALSNEWQDIAHPDPEYFDVLGLTAYGRGNGRPTYKGTGDVNLVSSWNMAGNIGRGSNAHNKSVEWNRPIGFWEFGISYDQFDLSPTYNEGPTDDQANIWFKHAFEEIRNMDTAFVAYWNAGGDAPAGSTYQILPACFGLGQTSGTNPKFPKTLATLKGVYPA